FPEGGASCAPSTRKRVVFFASSSMLRARRFSPYSFAAVLLAMAAAPFSPAASRAASALLTTAVRAACGRLRASHCWHCARLCVCEYNLRTALTVFDLL